MRNKHFGTRVFWLCGECPSTRYTANICAEEARPQQELADGCSKFKKIKRSVKRSDTLTCTRSSRPIHVEHNNQPVVRKSLCPTDSTKKLDIHDKGKDVVVDPSQRKLRKNSYISSDSCKTRHTKLLAPEEVAKLKSTKRSRLHGCVNELSCGSDKQKLLHPSKPRRKYSTIYPSTNINVFEDSSKRNKRPNNDFHPGSLQCISTGDGSDGVQKMKDSGLDGETHEKSRSPELVQFSPSHRTDAVTESNNCTRSYTSFEGKHESMDMEGNREIHNSDTSVPGVDALPWVQSPVSKDPTYVDPSSVKVPSENVSKHIDLDVHPGVSSLKTPRVSRCSSSQHPSSSHRTTCEGSMPSKMESGGHIVETTLEPHQVQPSNLDISSGFLEPTSGASNIVKSSAVNVPLKKVTNVIDPDTPPGFSSPRIPVPFGLPGSQHSNRSRKINLRDPRLSRMDSSGQIDVTTVGGYKPGSTPHQVEPKCHLQKADANLPTSSGFLEANPIDPGAASGSSLRNPGLSAVLRFLQQNSSQEANFKSPMLSSMEGRGHEAATNVGGYAPEVYVSNKEVETSHQHPSSSFPDIRMEPMSPIKYGGHEHSTTLGGYPHQHEVQPRFRQVGGPVYQDIRPGFSQFGPPAFPPLPSWSTRPSSLHEIHSEAAGSSRLDRGGHLTSTIVGGYAAPASQIHEMQPNYRQMPAGPHRPIFRPRFPTSPSNSTRRASSSLENPVNAAWSSRMAGRGHVPSNIVGGHATASSQQNRMQPNYPQGPPNARSNNEP